MFYAVGRLDLLIPESHSLKEKRSVLNRLKGRLESRFHLSVNEIDFQELHQRAALGVALVVRGPSRGRDALEAIRRLVEEDARAMVLEFRTRIANLDDEPGRTRDADDADDDEGEVEDEWP